MKCAVMQPTYIPWLGYFDLIDQVDKFVFLDDVKLEKCSWHVRNRIKTTHGELYLTIPVRRTKGRDRLIINEAIINEAEQWRKKHMKSIFYAYKKTRFFDETYVFMEEMLSGKEMLVRDLVVKIITSIAAKIHLKKNFFLSSEIKDIKGAKDLRVVNICKRITCDEYLSPKGAAGYIENKSPGGEFPKNGIKLFYQNYDHPVYEQAFGKFLPYMSVIDLLFNHGFERSLEIIRNGRRNPVHCAAINLEFSIEGNNDI